MPAHQLLQAVPYWVAILVAFPAILGGYFLIVIGSGSALGYEYQPKHDDLLYLPLIAVTSVALYFAELRTVPVGLEAWYVASPMIGIAMYALDTYLWSWWIGKPIDTGDTDPRWLLPLLLAPIGEEYLYRGLLSVLLTPFGAGVYVASSAVLFGANHFVGGPREIVLKTGNGALYAVLFLGTGSLVAPVLAHVGYNVAYIGFVSGRIRFPTPHD